MSANINAYSRTTEKNVEEFTPLHFAVANGTPTSYCFLIFLVSTKHNVILLIINRRNGDGTIPTGKRSKRECAVKHGPDTHGHDDCLRREQPHHHAALHVAEWRGLARCRQQRKWSSWMVPSKLFIIHNYYVALYTNHLRGTHTHTRTLSIGHRTLAKFRR